MDITTGALFSDKNDDKEPADSSSLSGAVLGDPLATTSLTGATDDAATDAATTVTTSDPEPEEDPAKINFIKTYTEKHDDLVRRATDAADKVLDSIDTAINEHTDDIAIPAEAREFIGDDQAPDKVERFDDAREIVRKIMEAAQAAKEESTRAAEEANHIYDEVQQFKQQIRDQIGELRQE
jgi:hypothetical protein